MGSRALTTLGTMSMTRGVESDPGAVRLLGGVRVGFDYGQLGPVILEKRMTMLSYHNDSGLKARFLGHIERHRKDDAFLRGTYGVMQEGKFRGCAVGCSIRSLDEIDGRPLKLENGSHKDLAERLGIPLILARLEDCIFEGLPAKEAMIWPGLFASAIPVGKDLSQVWDKFAYWLLVGDVGVVKLAKTERSKAAIEAVAQLYMRKLSGEQVERAEWQGAAAAAAADADAYAYAYAAYAYAAAASASAYAYAAYAYAAAASASADAYADADAAAAADADAYAYAAAASASAYAYAASAADYGRSVARQRHYTKMAEKLLQLMGEA